MDATETFRAKAPSIIAKLRGDFPFTGWDGAAIAGNLGYESVGFTKLQEIAPIVKGSRGGWGWAQWTGPRRRAFEAYCKRNKLDPASDKANYAWLFIELKGSERKAVTATVAATGIEAKARAFEQSFLRAGIKHYESRESWARQASDAYVAAGSPINATPAPDAIAILVDEASATDKRVDQAAKGAGGGLAGGGTITAGQAAVNHAVDWVTIGLGVAFVALVVGLIALAVRNARKSDALKEAAAAIGSDSA